ncbi:MAG: TonB-dependent receptor [Hyphomonadaceae bacterium]|nr:TonB-dependent receptor [Hyphomonadaceae bacterium]
MRPSFRSLLLASGMLAGFGATGPALAQDAGDEEIVVTARRTEERLQDVPGAVSAFNAAALERLGATEASGLQGAVPNVNIVQGRGSSNALNVYIRGVGQPDALQTFDPAIGFYVDDVYYSRIRGLQLDLFDVDRIEVLRGPQGTLFGKNTIGGAVRVVTRRPTQDTHAALQVTGGDFGQLEGRYSMSGGLTDELAAGFQVFAAARDGYVTNPVTGEDYNDRNVGAGRVQLAWDPASNFRLDVAADYAEESSALVLGQATNTLTTILGVPLLVIPTNGGPYNFEARPTTGLPNSTHLEHGGMSVTAAWDINDLWTLRSITAYRDLENRDFIDIDATPLELGDVLVDVDQNQTSQEFQLNFDGERLNLVSGIYYMRENIASHQEAYADDFVIGFLGATSFLRTVDDDLATDSWAAYINGTFTLSDALNLTLGVRYTNETKDYFRTTSTFSNQALLNGTFAFNGSETWTDTSPLISIDYRVNDNVLLYARAAEGFKSGGFNGRANAPGEDQPYDPEILLSYEAGAKTDWLEGRLRLNGDVFYNDYQDFQARVSRTVTSESQPVPAIDFAVLNAGSLVSYGAELELSYVPIDALRLDAQIGYLHAEYDEFFETRSLPNPAPPPANIPTLVDRSFQAPAFSPEWTARVGASYRFDLGNLGGLTANAAARYRSEMALAVDNSNIFTQAIFPGMWQDSYWLYDASLVWESEAGHVTAGVYGRNLGDELYRTDAQEFSSVGGIRTAYYGAPQTVSFVLGLKY